MYSVGGVLYGEENKKIFIVLSIFAILPIYTMYDQWTKMRAILRRY